MTQLEFAYLWAFALLPLPLLVYWLVPAYRSRENAIKVPFFTQILEALNETPKVAAGLLRASHWQQVTLILSWLLIVTALAKPSVLGEVTTREAFGRDVMMLVDLSGSMEEKDFPTRGGENLTRLDAAKQVLREFVTQRKGDRFGLILFGDAAFIQTPFTADQTVWLSLLDEAQTGMAGQSTNLGDAIGLGIKVFEQTPTTTQERIMVVLTDGNDTGSFVAPVDAAKIAASKGIRIYVIAMGDPENIGEQPLDMDVVNRVAELTQARSFVAIDQQQLNEAYQVIDKLEPQKYSSESYRPKISLHHYLIAVVLVLHLIVFSWMTLQQHLRNQEAANE
ncbi:VWA domain-containing protein [Vibrio fluvialis]|uniref:VWA domain-containing protein n=1 Tax=Vibrio fluvialis TaxID=676 RepID=UPI001C9C3E4D|nr:VWA domain-containing protein [Vibrio fluvialis]MBY7762925.1 VWA domain-containing protein [Vibrio fluvialis]MBY7771544.1 VWA domain-containing protein [Vibrio fluvialis]MBY7775886.1 VWA domain-containing protein [Vibrio fluvialis]MBY7985155.1 VWA domain-containing protein [Vibrio fluvialis]MBY7989502.1 VWA domain-containing protein [Vibrio fluvialis]